MRREHNDKDIDEKLMEEMYNEEPGKGENEESELHESSEHDEMDGLSEWNLSTDEQIQEFLSRDFNVVAESRRRMENNRNRAANGRVDKTDYKKNRGSRAGARSVNSRQKSVRNKRASDSRGKELENENIMKILFGILGALIAVLVVAIVVTYSGNVEDGEDVNDNVTTVSNVADGESSTEETAEPEPAIEPEKEDSDIHALIVGYIDAAYIQADMEAVALVVDDTTNINADKYKSRQKYIESYENICCYKFESAIDNSYIVFVTYDTKLYNITTLAPSAETFIVKYDTEADKYMIHNLTVGEELDSYIAGASKFAYTSEIRAEIEKRLNEALATDAELKRVYDLMISTGSKTTDEATSATSADENTTENTTTTEEQ